MNDLKRNFAYTPRTQNPPQSASLIAVPEGMFSPSFDPGLSCVTTGMLASPGGVDCERNRGGALFVVMLAVA